VLIFRSSDKFKVKVQYFKAISIHFMSIFYYGHIFPKKTLWFGEKSTFFYSTLFHDFSAFQPSWSAKDKRNTTLQLQRNSGKTDLVARIHQNSPKLAVFGYFLISSVSEVPFLRTLNPISIFHSSNMGSNIRNDWSMPQVYIKRNFQIWPKTKLSTWTHVTMEPENFWIW